MPSPVFNYDFYSAISSKLYKRWFNKLTICSFWHRFLEIYSSIIISQEEQTRSLKNNNTPLF